MADNRWVIEEAKNAMKRGIDVDIEGRPYDFDKPECVYHVRDSNSYMLDYESDLNGKIVALHINEVD